MTNINFGSFSKSRIEAFSDGIFAIVVTLLVLEIRIPHLESITNISFLHSLSEIIPKIISWVNSFLVVCVIWMNHHRLIDMFKKIDGGIFWFNNILLMTISFIPFPTAVLGEYTNLEYAVCFYGLCLSLMGLGFILLRIYVQRRPELLKEEVKIDEFRNGTKSSFLYGMLLYLIGAAISLFNPWVAFAIYFAIPVYFIFPKGTTGK